MPIYEYQSAQPEKGCPECRTGFEVIQNIYETPLTLCPACGRKIKKIISWCRSAVIEESENQTRTMKKIKGYEDSGMWSHAAELADTHSEKSNDPGLKVRALENYQKAGYDAGTLAKHAETKKD